MFRKIASMSAVVILLLLSFNTYSQARERSMLAQTFTEEEVNQQMEETTIFFEEAQEEIQENLDTIIEEQQQEETSDTFEEQEEIVRDFFEETEEEIDEQRNLIERMSAGIFLGATSIIVLIGLYLLAGIIVNVVMLMDCLKRDFKDRTMWIIILVVGTLLGFGAIPGVLYYFLVKKKLETGEKEEKEEKKE